MAQYTYSDFIKNNIAPATAKKIAVYNSSGTKVGEIPLGNLGRITAEEPLYKFGLLSDIHVDTTDYNYSSYLNTYPYSDEGEGDFRRALNWLVDHESVNMVCACGDMSLQGTTTEFAMPQSVIAEVLTTAKNIPFYTCTGNHDTKTAGGNGFGNYFLRSLETTWDGMTNFERSTGFNESFCFDKAAGEKTDHFIFFSMYSYSLGSSASPYNDADITWLSGKLSGWKNDRVFIFTHLFFPDYAGNLGRVNGSGGIYPSGNWLGGTQLTTLQGLMQNYPNTIWFSGHSHWKWDLQKYQENINVQQYNDGAWTVHVPSCALPIDSDYTNTSSETDSNRVEKPLESQGGVVWVYADRIEIHGIDFNVNASQNGSTTQQYSGSDYVRYLPIAHYNMSTVLKTVTKSNDPVEGYYIVTSNSKNTGETITKEGDYIILTFTKTSQCVGITNGALTADDATNGVSITVDDIIVEYGGTNIDLANITKLGFYTTDSTYADLSTVKTSGISGLDVEEFTAVDSNNANSTTAYYVQFNVSSSFATNNDWASVTTTPTLDETLVIKIKNLKINGVLVNTQSGNITGVSEDGTLSMVAYTYAELDAMTANESKDVIVVNPHKSNGYILGHNGTSAISTGNGFATKQNIIDTVGTVAEDNTYLMSLTKHVNTDEANYTFAVTNGTANFVELTSMRNAEDTSETLSTPSGDYIQYIYDITNVTSSNTVNNTTFTVSYLGTYPQTIYLYVYCKSTNSNVTGYIRKSGSTTNIVSKSTSTSTTSITTYTQYTLTESTTFTCYAKGNNTTNREFKFYVVVPSYITETTTGTPYYTLTSKAHGYGPAGTTSSATWSTATMKYFLENATTLGSDSDLTSGVSTSDNNLIRFKNESDNYLNAGGGLTSLKFATGTGEWSVWQLYKPDSKTYSGGTSGSTPKTVLKVTMSAASTGIGILCSDTTLTSALVKYDAIKFNAGGSDVTSTITAVGASSSNTYKVGIYNSNSVYQYAPAGTTVTAAINTDNNTIPLVQASSSSSCATTNVIVQLQNIQYSIDNGSTWTAINENTTLNNGSNWGKSDVGAYEWIESIE